MSIANILTGKENCRTRGAAIFSVFDAEDRFALAENDSSTSLTESFWISL
jgi:hypothetical protein